MRLAKPAARQEMIVKGWARRVDQDKVEVSMQTSVLESIIKDNAVMVRVQLQEVRQPCVSIRFGDNRDAVEGCPRCDAAVRNGRGAPDRAE